MRQILILVISLLSFGIHAEKKNDHVFETTINKSAFKNNDGLKSPTLELNDEPSTASSITASPDYRCENSVSGTFEGATRSPEFPCTAQLYANYKDLWYKLVPTASGKHSFSLAISGGTAASLVVWRQQTDGTLTAISSGCLTRYTTQDLVVGATYYISVASEIPTLNFTLCVKELPASTNNEPAVAQPITESTYKICENAVEGNTALATHSTDSGCASSTADVWYTFTPTKTAEYTFKRTFLSGGATTGVTVYSGTPGSLTMLTSGCGNQIVLVNLTAGQTYYVAVSTSTTSDPVYFSLCAYPSPPAPLNDSCATPTKLEIGKSFDGNAVIADNTSGTVDLENTPSPTCGVLEFPTRGRDIWYTVIVPPSGNFIVETQSVAGSLVTDTVLETYEGSCGLTDLRPYYYDLPAPNVGTAYCNDQFVIGANQFAGIKFTNKTPGDVVIIRAWCWASQFGEFKISVYDDTVMATKETEKNVAKIYPNPVHDVLNIQNSKTINDVIIYDTSGKMVTKISLNSEKGSIDVSKLNVGMYILKLISGDSTETVKFIKK